MASPGEPDFDALEKLVGHVADGGVSGLFILGTTGEGPSLSRETRREIVRRVCRLTTLPILVGLCDPSTAENLELARFAAQEGACGLVVTPPYYFNLNQAELLGYLQRTLPDLELPVYLYNIPGLTKVAISTEVLSAITSIPNFVGLKDSSGDLQYLAAARRALPSGFRLFCGPEEMLFPAVTAGADGGVCGGSNLFPRLYVQLYQAAKAGNADEAQRLQDLVLTVSRNVYSQVDSPSSYLRGMKCALSALGFGSSALAEPLTAVDGPARDSIYNFVCDARELLGKTRSLSLTAQ